MISLLSVICKPKYLAVLGTTIALAIIADYSPAHAGGGEWMNSESIDKSKHNKIFIEEVQVTPNKFKVENVDIEVREAWLEHQVLRPDKKLKIIPGYALCFTLLLNGKREEGRFKSEHCLDFIPPDTLDKYRWVDYKWLDEIKPWRNGFPLGYMRHVFYIPEYSPSYTFEAYARFTPYKFSNIDFQKKKFWLDEITQCKIPPSDYAAIKFTLPIRPPYMPDTPNPL